MQPIDLKLSQGRVYAVVGIPSNGKASLLRLIAKVLYPSEGEVYVPPHLHIVHVEQQSQLMEHLSLFENLVFGFRYTKPPLDRVCAVCEAVGISQKWIDHLREEELEKEIAQRGGNGRTHRRSMVRVRTIEGATEYSGGLLKEATVAAGASWHDELSHSEIHLICLARGLLTAPHLLVLHRPLAGLDEELAAKVAAALRSFVVKRGQVGELAAGGNVEGREARTVIFTCSMLDEFAIEAADDVVVCGHNQVRPPWSRTKPRALPSS